MSIFDEVSFVLVLRSRWQAIGYLLIAAVPAAAMMIAVVGIMLSASWGASFEVSSLQRAVWLDRRNAEWHYLLGAAYLQTVDAVVRGRSVGELREAVQLNPYSPIYWSGLAKACYAAGDQNCADRSFQRATEAAPNSPQFLWEAAVYSVAAGQRGPAVARMRRFIELQPERSEQAFELLLPALGDPNAIWRDVLNESGANLRAKLAFLDFLAERDEFDIARACWTKLAAQAPSVRLVDVQPYLERLISRGHDDEAARVWQWLERTGAVGLRRSGQEMVFNGGFERTPLNAGFDWRYEHQPFVELDFHDPVSHGGNWALRVEFTVPHNAEHEIVYQLVPVIPGKTYVLSAYSRSEAITSDSGPRLRVTDLKRGSALDKASDGVTGTTAWFEQKLSFTAGPETRMVKISLWRPRGRSFPMDISGSAWFDDVSLRPATVADGFQPQAN